MYHNPIINTSLPDPTVIRASDGNFYLYATEDIRNTPIYKSGDLVHWTYAGTAFTNSTRPTLAKDGGIWAPDINYINGQYVLYYAMSTWGGEWQAGIGAAVADRPEGPFKDCGKVLTSMEDWCAKQY
ncbi:MAG: family 43 glycosylhydrolase [Hoylesella buccalis]